MRWRSYIGGAAVQGSITAALATQALLAPRILGAVDYGTAVAVLAMAFLVEVCVETVVLALTIRWGMSREPELRRLWTDAVTAAPFLGLLAVAFSLSPLWSLSPGERWTFVAGVPLLLTIWIPATVLIGTAYALHRHVAIARCYLLGAIVLPGTIFLLRAHGSRSFLFGLLVDNVVAFASLAADRPVRDFCRGVAASAAARLEAGRVWREYLPVLTPRLTLLLLSPGLVAAGAMLLPPYQLAGFKVSLSFVTAAGSVLPVSQYMLQAQWGKPANGREPATSSEIRFVLLGVLVVGIAFAAGLLLWGDALRAFVLHTADPVLRRFDVVFSAVPLFVLVGPLSAYLTALGDARRMVLGFAASVAALVVSTAAGGLEWGFVGGNAAFVFFAASGVFSSAQR